MVRHKGNRGGKGGGVGGDDGRESGSLDGFAWLADRLAAMGPAEIAFRFEEQFKRAVSRIYQPNFERLIKSSPDSLPAIPGLADGLMGLADKDHLCRDWRRLAEQMRHGRFQSLGVSWPDRPGTPDWHIDPSTKTAWPSDTYCFDIPFRYGSERGDVKFVIELNRLQYLQPMAAAAAIENDSELAALVVRHMDSWIAANPPITASIGSPGLIWHYAWSAC